MRINFKGKVIVLITTMFLTALLPEPSDASTEMYSVKPVLTDKQVDGVENYVSIKTDGDLNEVFKYKITNRSDEDLSIKLEALNALTSSNGVIQYVKVSGESNSIVTDETYLFTEYVNTLNSVTVPAKESKIVEVEIKMPNVNGQVLGGIGFSSIEKGEDTVEGDSQFTINNELKTVIGFLVDFGGESVPEFKFGEPFISPMPSYYALRLPIEFNSSVIVTNPTIKYEVRDSEDNLVFNSIEGKPLNFAPMTKTNYVIPWDNPKISKGKEYHLTGELSYISNGVREQVLIDKKFSMTGDETTEDNSLISNPYEEVEIEGLWGTREFISDNKLITSILGGIVLMFVILTVMFVRGRKTKDIDKYEMIMFSNSPQCPEFITQGDEVYLNKLELMDEASNKDSKKFGLVYILTNDTNEGNPVFKLDRIINL